MGKPIPGQHEPRISFQAVASQVTLLKDFVVPGLQGELREDIEQSLDMFLEELEDASQHAAVDQNGEKKAYRDCMSSLDAMIGQFKEFKLEGINQLQILRKRFLDEYLKLKDNESPGPPAR